MLISCLLAPLVHLQNITAWLVAGGVAYYLYVVPDKRRAEEQQVGAHPPAQRSRCPAMTATMAPGLLRLLLCPCCALLSSHSVAWCVLQLVREQAKRWAEEAAAAEAAKRQ